MDILALWDFDDVAASEARMRAAMEGAGPADLLLLKTQIARTYSLRRRFADAQQLLDELAVHLDGGEAELRVRWLLESGRTFRSSGDAPSARPLFEQAFAVATDAGLDYLAVDAAHMMALVASDTPGALAWNKRALECAAASNDATARRWRGSLLNNIGWSHHDAGDFAAALEAFEQALDARMSEASPNQSNIWVARWAVARAMRSIGRIDEALAIQHELEQEMTAAGHPDGFVCEELGELYYVAGQLDAARPWFARAYQLLSDDSWFAQNESKRLLRLKELS